MKVRFSQALAGLAGILASMGCSHLPMNPAYQGPKPRPAPFIAHFQFPKLPELAFTHGITEDEDDPYRIRSMSVCLENKFADHLDLDFYEQKAEGKFPLLVISTILSDPSDVLARLVADYFADRGYNCAIVTRGAKKLDLKVQLDDIEEWQRAMLRDYAAVKQILTREPKVDPNRLATYGISYGALSNTVLAGTDDSYKAHVIGLAGGPLHEVLERSHEPQLRLFMRAYCRQHGCSREDFIERWRHIQNDPLKVAPYIDASKVLLVLSRFDIIVPYENGQKLRRAMGEPETLLLFAGHYTAIPYLAYVLPHSREFLDRKLGVKRTTAGETIAQR